MVMIVCSFNILVFPAFGLVILAFEDRKSFLGLKRVHEAARKSLWITGLTIY